MICKSLDFGETVAAIVVLESVQATLVRYGEEYANSKADIFLARCGAKINLGPHQRIKMSTVSRVAYDMFDDTAGAILANNMKNRIIKYDNPEKFI